MKNKPSEDGFVLAELLVAMVVLAIAAIGFLQTMQGSAKRIKSIKTSVVSHALAIDIMNATLSQTHAPQEVQEGRDEDSGLYWRVNVMADKTRETRGAEQPSILILKVEVWKQTQAPFILTSAKWIANK